jgi:hypothetical protein
MINGILVIIGIFDTSLIFSLSLLTGSVNFEAKKVFHLIDGMFYDLTYPYLG